MQKLITLALIIGLIEYIRFIYKNPDLLENPNSVARQRQRAEANAETVAKHKTEILKNKKQGGAKKPLKIGRHLVSKM